MRENQKFNDQVEQFTKITKITTKKNVEWKLLARSPLATTSINTWHSHTSYLPSVPSSLPKTTKSRKFQLFRLKTRLALLLGTSPGTKMVQTGRCQLWRWCRWWKALFHVLHHPVSWKIEKFTFFPHFHWWIKQWRYVCLITFPIFAFFMFL